MNNMTYNNKISDRANASMQRRKETIQKEKRIIAFTVILIISIITILCSSIKAFATSEAEAASVSKLYKSIQVESGDTLWDIAERYNLCSDLTREQYINEIKTLNNLTNDEIHSGEYIVVSYYEIND